MAKHIVNSAGKALGLVITKFNSAGGLPFSTFTPFGAFPNLKPFRIKFILKRILLKDESKNIQNKLGPLTLNSNTFHFITYLSSIMTSLPNMCRWFPAGIHKYDNNSSVNIYASDLCV